MKNKQDLLIRLREAFESWEELLARMSEEQITAPPVRSDWSVKDVIAHLMAWQQVSIARLEAALLSQEPELPKWLAGLDPESEDHRDEFNARIYEGYREQPWLSVHGAWREGFLRFLQLAEAIPDSESLDAGRYPWLKGYSLAAVLYGSYEHHQEHLEPLLAWLRQQEKTKIAGSTGGRKC